MKRIPFKTEFVPKVLSGEKRHTARWKSLGVPAGGRFAATCRQGTTPAFLVPASKAFARGEVVAVLSMRWDGFTDYHAALCGVTRDWYLRERPDAKPFDMIYLYEFALETPDPTTPENV